MGKIRSLDYSTIVKIAAGEVIDRPASVVRELIDNAIDAQASSVSVLLLDGGKSYIETIDNGEGMDRSDLEVCYKDHTTSKIAHIDDLSALQSLGFRGEALSSVAEVGELTIRSRQPQNDSGFELDVRFGELKSLKEAGINSGTTVIVKNLFQNLPARRKFLSGDAAETKYVEKEIIKKALGYPGVGFELKSDGKQKFISPSKNTYLERIADFFPDALPFLLPVEMQWEAFRITGFVGQPAFIRPNRMYEYIFVNGRPVEWKSYFPALGQAYGDMIPKGFFPASFLYLETDSATVDFNIHPMKREVKFQNEQQIFRFIHEAVKNALFAFDGVSETDQSQMRFTGYERKIADAIRDYADTSRDSQMSLEFVPPRHPIAAVESAEQFGDTTVKAPNESVSEVSEEWKYVGMAFTNYIVMEESERLIFVDQHAAHERINYEKLKKRFQNGKLDSQELLIPIRFDVPRESVEEFIGQFGVFSRMGFEAEHFGDTTFILRAIPDYVRYEDAAAIATGFVQALAETDKKDLKTDGFTDRAMKQMACKRSVRSGEKIGKEEALHLIDELRRTENPHSCPHGRPVMISIRKRDIENQFKRLGF